MKMFSDKAQKVLSFLQENANVDMTAKELAEVLEIPNRSMTGTLNALQKKGLLVREVHEVGDIAVKYIRLTPAGQEIDPNADKPEQ